MKYSLIFYYIIKVNSPERAIIKEDTSKEELAVIEAEKTIVMDVDPLANNDEEEKLLDIQALDDTILPVLPRAPSLDEQKQRFIMYNLPTDPANFMR